MLSKLKNLPKLNKIQVCHAALTMMTKEDEHKKKTELYIDDNNDIKYSV